jgi:hypothetical protein
VIALVRLAVYWIGALLALADAVRDVLGLWWRVVREPAWVRSVVQDLDAEQPR